MIIGQTIHAGTTEIAYYSPWFSRGGNRALMTCNLMATGGAISKFKIQVQTKNSEDADNVVGTTGYPVFESSNMTSTAADPETWEAGEALSNPSDIGLLELVRFKYVLQASSGMCWVHFRVLAPQWFSN